MPQYSTPQFIEEEGRITFFLTFRQFFLLVGGGVACILLYFILPFFIFLALAIPIMLLMGAVAFIKIGNESIIKVLFHAIFFIIGKKNYIWRKKELNYQPNSRNLLQPNKIGEMKKMIETKR